MKMIIVLISILASAAPLAAGVCQTVVSVRGATRTVTLSSGLSVVPFAVPVAVPVAAVNHPAVFYGYRQFAPAPAESWPPDTAPSDAAVDEQHTTANIDNASRAAEILSRRCAACHTGQASRGGLQIFREDEQIFERLPRHVILEMAAPDDEGLQRMPPGDRPKLTSEELEVLREWARLPKNAVY